MTPSLSLLLLDPVAWLGAYATIMSVVVMVVVGFSAFTSYFQFKQNQDSVDRMRGQVEKAEADYKLSGLRPPEEIVHDVQSLYDPRIEQLRAGVERLHTDVERELEIIREALQRLASKDSILREVEAKFGDPKALEETILRKVLDAFLRVQNLTQSEQQAISQTLVTQRNGPNPPSAATTTSSG